MGYKKRPGKSYLAQQRWAARAFKDRRIRIKRYLVHYEAVVNEAIVANGLFVLASNEKEALAKARNIVKSFHPKAKGIAVAIKEEHIN
ncbi:MAG: hypothetical protein ACPLZY_03410 [Candidatus Norongarragalinales archaeon]